MKLHLTYTAKNCALVLLAALFLVLYYYVKPHSLTVKHPAYSEMITAAKKMQQAQQAIRQEMSRRGIEIDTTVDRLDSGLIGLEWSGITTTLGNVESKRTTVNPDFAALLVKLFKEAGLQKGDTIAANCSSSFPALNLAFIAATDAMGLQPIMVTSIGSSMYGGNREEFTYLDMEQYLYEQKIIAHKTIAYSLGGVKDVGQEFEPDLIEHIKERLNGYGLTFFYEADFEKNLTERYAFYTEGSRNDTAHTYNNAYTPIKAFINIGGNLLSVGEYNDSITTETVRLSASTPIKTGLVGKFLQSGTPVFYLLNIKSIARYYQLPVDPITLPEIGTAPIYYYRTVQHIWNYVILGLFLVALYLITGCHNLFFYEIKNITDF
ncbi:poly-gamma-glutamate system protein [Treponema sp. OMZ 805]|uniref:poly-gamma-glutamate system protein n=1 Tax=Treponema sp. OMZ 805 TaxID=2726068 RepID=UPI003D8F2A61